MKKKRLVKRIFVFNIITLIIIVGIILLYIKTAPKLEIKSANSIYLYNNKKKVVYKGNESKEWVSLDDISDYVIDATINTEDKNFYKHFGFDLLRILKASYINITNHKTLQGASTITQQYAKNLFLDFSKTWKRKWDEAWYTLRIEDAYSKDEILEGYLNTINYGHGKYGIENASKFYFNKSAKDLDLAEATLLTGIPKAPSNYSPLINMDLCKERQKQILDLLVNNDVISSNDSTKAYNEDVKIIGSSSDDDNLSNMYYYDAVMDELKTIKNIPNSYEEIGGLKIYTTLDSTAQKNLEANIKETIPDESLVETSAIMMNPNTGGILALVGGRDYDKSSFNRATSSFRQVGSTMKPYLYYAALENGFTSSSSFTSEATTFSFENDKTYAPKNYNEKYGNKPISMATAIAYSDNIFAVKTHLFLGSSSLINVARRVGITEKLEDIPSLPLGTNEISIINMSAGYSAFANTGYKVKPHLIEKIVDGKGNVLYKTDKSKSLVLNSSLVYILNNMLTSTYDPLYIDYNYPTAISLSSKLTHKYALKSGTTDTDNWNIGFNKDILVSVWVGYDDNQSLKTSEYKYAQNIWYKSIENYEKDKPDDWYEKPDNVNAVEVEPISGKPISSDTDKKKLMYFIKGTEPLITDKTFDEISSASISN